MSRHKSKLLVYAFLLLAAFLILFVRSDIFNPLKFRVIQVASLPIRILRWPILELKKVIFYHRIYDEYIALKKEASHLRERLIGMDEVVLQNARLEKLLNLKRELVFSSVAANVVGRDPTNWNATMIIDKGRTAGIRTGMPVISSLGVVGKIAEVSDEKAKVILLTDPAFSVAALVKRSREIGVVSGTLRGLCRLRYLDPGADVRVGDYVISSKLSSSFPEGLLVGDVVEVNYIDNDPPVVDCLIRPAVSLSQVEEVLVIKKD